MSLFELGGFAENPEVIEGTKEEFSKLYDGTIITSNNRTFIEACYENGWNDLADGLSKVLKEEKQLRKVK